MKSDTFLIAGQIIPNNLISQQDKEKIKDNIISYSPSFSYNYSTKNLKANKSGLFTSIPDFQIYSFSSNQRIAPQFFPKENDVVIGHLISRNAEFYTLDIRCYTPAILPILQFEGATKRNHPDLKPGAAVYCRVARVNQHMSPQLSCISPFHKKSWNSGESFFGELSTGVTIQLSPLLTHYFLQSEVKVLDKLAEIFQFQVAIGMNHIIWVSGENSRETLLIVNVIKQGDQYSQESVRLSQDKMLELIKGIRLKLSKLSK